MALLEVHEFMRDHCFVLPFQPCDPAGDAFNNATGDVFLAVNSRAPGRRRLRIKAQKSALAVPGLGAVVIRDLECAIPAGRTVVIGPYYESKYNDPDSIAHVEYDDAAGLEICAVRSVDTVALP